MLGFGGSVLVIVERGGAGPQWDVPQIIGAVLQAGNYDSVVFHDFHIKFDEDGDTVVIAELPCGYE